MYNTLETGLAEKNKLLTKNIFWMDFLDDSIFGCFVALGAQQNYVTFAGVYFYFGITLDGALGLWVRGFSPDSNRLSPKFGKW